VLLSFDLFLGTKYAENVSLLTFYLMGADAHVYPDAAGNYWTTLDTWPAVQNQTWYFDSNFGLSTSPPSAISPSTTYLYDPQDPVPTIGGSNLFIACGPLDQTSVEMDNRTDVLTFTSQPLSEPLAVVGPLIATIWVSSDQVDTDFTVKLTDVYPFPNGASRLINDGMVRMRWREYDHPVNMTPGQVYQVQVNLWSTAYVFDTDHRIRVDISSSNYPRFSVNPNNGWPLNTTNPGPLYSAKNTLYHNPQQPSYITLPVAKLSDMPVIHIYDEWVPLATQLVGTEKFQRFLEESPLDSAIPSFVKKAQQEISSVM